MKTLALAFGMARRDEARWIMCFAVVLLAHASVALALLYQPPEAEFGIDGPIVNIALSESFVVATPPEEDTPPPKEAEPKPPEPETEVALPEPPKPEPQEQKEVKPVPHPPAAAVRRWESALVAHIERFKRYPADARARGDQGIVRIAFTIDREGWVRGSRILQSSGSSELDQEVLGMLVRAQPVPRPPEHIPAEELSFKVPFQFSIR
jgi:TonB family protein